LASRFVRYQFVIKALLLKDRRGKYVAKIQNERVPRTLSAYISNKQLLPFFSRFFKRGNKICVTRDTKLDAKRAAASATLAERFMKREEREIVRPSSFALAFLRLDVKTRKRHVSCRFEFATICVSVFCHFFFLILPRAFHEKQELRAIVDVNNRSAN